MEAWYSWSADKEAHKARAMAAVASVVALVDAQSPFGAVPPYNVFQGQGHTPYLECKLSGVARTSVDIVFIEN